MGIYGAMTTAVSGLRAQSYALENISGNIANSQTTGFKRVDTSFVDLVPDQPQGREVAGSVTSFSRLTNTLQGDLTSTGVPTNLALNGEGFFIVQERSGYSGNRPVFNGVDLYTRRGDFQLDKDGYLVNGAGFYLRGQSIDPATGMAVGAGSDLIRISSAPVPARATTLVNYEATLPTNPATKNSDPTVPGSELLSPPPIPPMPVGYNPAVTAVTAPAPGVRGDDTTRFMNESVSGGAITVYNSVGTPVSMQVRWAKIDNAPTWNMFYLENSTASGATVSWRNLGTPITFNAAGAMTSPSVVNIPSLTIDGVAVGSVDVDFGTNGLNQYATSNGLVQQRTLQQDGYQAGTLDSVSVTSDGRISGSYTNGRIVPVAQIPVVQFNAPNALKRLDSGAYAQTLESGVPIIGLDGTTLVGGHLESSNTDIAEEFSKMIVTQQAYSANTRVVSTSQQMMSEIVNMVR